MNTVLARGGGGLGSIAARGVRKSFGGVAALRDVTLEIPDGSAIGLVGENGAGKSTLINILTGALRPDAGTLAIDAQPVALRTPNDAIALGIGTVHQQNWLVPGFTALENLDLGQEQTRTPMRMISRRARPQSLEALELVGLTAKARRPASELSLADRQLVAIASASSRGSRLIIFDEPTAALSPAETDRLFQVIEGLRAMGRSILYVTHRLEELAQVTERITIMRAGQVVAERSSDEREQVLVQLIAGENMPEIERGTVAARRQSTMGPRFEEPILIAEGLTDSEGAYVDVDLTLAAGEVLAVVGLPDSGAVELVRSIAGARRVSAGRLAVSGRTFRARSPRDAIRHGVGYLPGDRKLNGVIPNASVAETVTLSALREVSRWGWVSRRRQRRFADELTSASKVRSASNALPITALSGGNQQKALFARTLGSKPRVIVCEDPTAGVDPAGRESLYELLADACGKGNAVVFYSSDLREVVTLADRAVVLWRGRLVGEIGRSNLSVPSLMSAQFNQATAAAAGDV